MKFSIITPTLQRPSLAKTCQMIDAQSYANWEHIVAIDSASVDEGLMTSLVHPKRIFLPCGVSHADGGNTCRHNAFSRVTGDYVMYCDDDNHYADDHVLADVVEALIGEGYPAWGLFPINRLGGRFYTDPPRSCHVDTMNFVLRKDVGIWPATNAYGSDGILVDSLMERGIPYAAFPDFREIGVIPQLSFCK